VSRTGDALSMLDAPTDGWHAANLPTTVLGTLIEEGRYGDPFYADRFKQIPGQGPAAQNFANHAMPEDSPFAVPWWFRKEIAVVADAPQYLGLRLDGINYRANVWLNGELIANSDDVVGSYRDYELDVSRKLRRGSRNALAIEVIPPRPCDLAISWVDWNPSPPDKNTGIWRDVWLRGHGPVGLRDPYVITELDDRGRAQVSIAVDVLNTTDAPQDVELRARLGSHATRKTARLKPRERRRITIDPSDDRELSIHQPKLWWPRGLGEAELHELSIEAVVAGRLSDRSVQQVGLRQITSELTEKEHALFRVNGEPLLIKGAGWATDLFLRRRNERDWAELEYVKAMNLNTIRFEGMLERADFLERCDRDGLLVIAGWCCCDCWEKWDEWSGESHVVALESLRSQLRRVRRHPSMISWWYGSDFPPPAHVEQAYLEVLKDVGWPNATQSSAANKPTELTGRSGVKMEGPYDYVPPSYWLEDKTRGGGFGFATEVCPGPAIPPIESLRKMLPTENLWPIDDMWNYHAGGQEFHQVEHFARAVEGRYGPVDDVETFAQLSQLLAYDSQRAMFEAYAKNRHDGQQGNATGVIQWMLNNAWPSLIWHLYDHYLRPGGGFFGTQKACEPLHVMYAYDDRSVVVSSDHLTPRDGLTLRARVLSLAGDLLHDELCLVDARPHAATTALTLPELSHRREAIFVALQLYDERQQLVSDNVYLVPAQPDVLDHDKGLWIHTPVSEHADLIAVRTLPAADIRLRAQRDPGGEPGEQTIRIKIRNSGDSLAFFVQLRARDEHGADLLPVIYSDNYISLLPGDSREITVRLLSPPRMHSAVLIEARGLNIERMVVPAYDPSTEASPNTCSGELQPRP
jgi:exo-1,4-beta-D-glucosaminidase